MSSQITLTVPEDHALVAMVREVGRTLLAHHGASTEDIEDLEAVLGELCANVTCHAHSESGCYRVTLEHQGHRVVVTVTDDGRGFDPQRVPPVGTPCLDEDGTERYGGFGLHLVGSLVDRLEIGRSHPRGMTVRAEKRMRAGDAREMARCTG